MGDERPAGERAMRPEDYRPDIEAAVAEQPCVCGGRDNPDCERCVLVAVARAWLAEHPPADPVAEAGIGVG